MGLLMRFLYGFSAPFAGWRLIRSQPRLWIWSVLPLLIQLGFVIAGWIYGATQLSTLLGAILGAWLSPDSLWYGILYYPLWALALLAVVIVWTYLILAISTLIAAPFLSRLAEESLRASNYPLPQFVGGWKRFRFILRTARRGFIKGALLGAVGVVVFVGQFLPGLNIALAYLGLVLLAFDCLDYSLEVMDMGLIQRVHHGRAMIPELMGLGAVLTLTLILPGLTVLLLPFAVAGMSQLVVRHQGV